MKTQISIIVFLVFITGCRPEQEATSFNNIIRGEQNVEAPQSSDTSNIFNSDVCMEYDDQFSCNNDLECQIMFSEDNEFVSCISIPSQSSIVQEPQEQPPSDTLGTGYDPDIISEQPVAPLPVEPIPVVLVPIAPTPAELTPVMPTLIEPTPVAFTPVAPEPHDSTDVPPLEYLSNQSSEDHDDESNSDDENNYEDENAANQICKNSISSNHKIVICHFPKGNSKNAHTLCVAKNAWENAHKNHLSHDGHNDHKGACTEEDLSSSENDEEDNDDKEDHDDKKDKEDHDDEEDHAKKSDQKQKHN